MPESALLDLSARDVSEPRWEDAVRSMTGQLLGTIRADGDCGGGCGGCGGCDCHHGGCDCGCGCDCDHGGCGCDCDHGGCGCGHGCGHGCHHGCDHGGCGHGH